jgi:glycosyl hydrolase family 113
MACTSSDVAITNRRRIILGGAATIVASCVPLKVWSLARPEFPVVQGVTEPRMGFNLISWDPATNNDPRAWERAVRQIHGLGVARITVIGYHPVDRATGRIGGRSRFDSALGPSKEVLAAAMTTARSLGMAVSLKHFIEIDNPKGEGSEWRGDLDFEEPKLTEFFREYEAYVLDMAQFAQQHGASRYYIGSELSALTRNPAAQPHWLSLIAKCRKVYRAAKSEDRRQLTYAANFDEYQHVRFWDQLDEIGIDAYFPLTPRRGLSSLFLRPVQKMVGSWHKILPDLQQFQEKHGRQILFSEWGVVPFKGTSSAPFEWQPSKVSDRHEALSAYRATLLALDDQDECWLSGVDFWHWNIAHEDESNYAIRAESDVAHLIHRFNLRGRAEA